MISSLGLADSLRQHFGSVDLLIREEYAPLLADEPDRNVVTLDEAGQRTYNLLVDLDSTRTTRPLARRLRARHKIGFYWTSLQYWRFSLTYRSLIRRHADVHMTARYDLLMDRLGIAERYPPSLQSHHPLSAAVRDIPGNLRTSDRPLVGVHVGAGNPLRVLPDSILGPLVDFCRDRSIQLLFLGVEDELRRAADPRFGGYPRAVPSDLADLKGVISRLDAFVGPDSGLLHLAAALHTPAIGLFGPNVSRRSAPPSPQVHVFEIDLPCRPCDQKSCPYERRCLTGLPVDQILDRLDMLLPTE
jgi:ADP-heptose:LPS heptosyltransferase